jgi:hypothetical protein
MGLTMGQHARITRTSSDEVGRKSLHSAKAPKDKLLKDTRFGKELMRLSNGLDSVTVLQPRGLSSRGPRHRFPIIPVHGDVAV